MILIAIPKYEKDLKLYEETDCYFYGVLLVLGNVVNNNINIEGGAGGSKQDSSEAKERLLKLINDLRKAKFDARPQRMGTIISATLDEVLSQHGEKACVTVAESYFEWEGLRSKFATVQSTFSNFEKKMQIALAKNQDIASPHREINS